MQVWRWCLRLVLVVGMARPEMRRGANLVVRAARLPLGDFLLCSQRARSSDEFLPEDLALGKKSVPTK